MIKNILFRYSLEGKGIVNYDSSDQSYIHNKYKTTFRGNNNSNVNYSKKHFTKNEENSLDWKISISSDCLKHNIFIKDAFCQSPSILKDDFITYSYLATPASLLRGYLLADSKITIKRKGPVTILDAEQNCNSISTIEQFAKSGSKFSGKTDENGVAISSDTFFSKERIGNIKYEGDGHIDLMQLQFISCDQQFDRMGFDPSNIEIYKSILNSYLQQQSISYNLEIKNYLIKNSIIKISEEGILFSNEIVNFLVREFFTKMLEFEIRRSSSFVKLSKLEYKLVEDCIEDTMKSETGWISLSSREDVKNISFTMQDFYIEADPEIVKRTKENIEKYNLLDTKNRKEKKEKSSKIKVENE